MVLITAHEGCEGSPSNTLASVLTGIKAEADIIEVDVRSTKDNVAILSHSSTIETVSGNRISLREIDFNDILILERDKLIKFEHSEGKVTRLAEVFDLIRGSNRVINLDVKDDESIESIVKTVNAENMLDHVFISGCERLRASYFKQNYPEFQVLFNVGTALSNLTETDEKTAIQTIYRYASQAGCCGINIPYQFCTPEIVNFMHRRFLPVSVWTVDDTTKMQSIIDMEVYSITTNKPGELKKLLNCR